MNPLNDQITDLAKSLGATQIGFADLSPLKNKDRLGYERAISVIVQLSAGVLSQIKDEPTITYFSHYRSVNRLIDEITLRILLTLEASGYPSFAVPASQSLPSKKEPYQGIFQHKTAAVLSGIGWIGKSALFIHRDYGPAVRLGTVLTNAPLNTPVVHLKSKCGSCDICKKTCPAMAIEGINWEPGIERSMLYDARCCSEYMKEAYQHIGRGSVCGLCIVNCPHFRKKRQP